MEIEVIRGTIPNKSNSYVIGRVNGHSCIVKSNEVKRYEREFLRQCTIYKGRGISTPFRLVVDVYYPDHTHDLDGCFKVLLDLLQACGAIVNDNLCVHIEAHRHFDRYRPRVEFAIEELNEQKQLFY